jgi:hypothetical protein
LEGYTPKTFESVLEKARESMKQFTTSVLGAMAPLSSPKHIKSMAEMVKLFGAMTPELKGRELRACGEHSPPWLRTLWHCYRAPCEATPTQDRRWVRFVVSHPEIVAAWRLAEDCGAALTLYERAVAPYCPWEFMARRKRVGRWRVPCVRMPIDAPRLMFIGVDWAKEEADFYNEHAPRTGDLL